MTGLSFCLSTMIGSIISTHFSEIWYGIGLVAGCFGIAGNYLGSKLFVNKGAKWTKPLIVTVLVIFFCKVCYELVTGG